MMKDTGWNERQECSFGSTRLTHNNKFTEGRVWTMLQRKGCQYSTCFNTTQTQRPHSAVYSLDVSTGMYREAWRTPVVALDQKWDSDTRNGDDQKQNKEMSTPIKKFDVLVTQLSTVRYHLV